MDTIHIDEKQFNQTKEKKIFYLEINEENHHRTTKIKSFIPKVLFLAAVARPWWDTGRNQWFDGKLGIWPFTSQEPAERNSKNRAKGTIIMKSIIMTKEVYRDVLINKLFPAIVAKWSWTSTGVVVDIQQGNAKPRIDSNDEAWLAAVTASGINIQLKF